MRIKYKAIQLEAKLLCERTHTANMMYEENPTPIIFIKMNLPSQVSTIAHHNI